MSNCSQYRLKLEVLPSLDCKDPLFASLLAHLKECSACMEKYRQIKKSDRLLGEAFGNIAVSPLLEENVRAALEKKRSGKKEERLCGFSQLELLASHSAAHHLAAHNGHGRPAKRFSLADTRLTQEDPPELLQARLRKCSLGGFQAEFLRFEEEGRHTSLYMVPDKAIDAEQWDGGKKTYRQGKYKVLIWKEGEVIFSKVLERKE